MKSPDLYDYWTGRQWSPDVTIPCGRSRIYCRYYNNPPAKGPTWEAFVTSDHACWHPNSIEQRAKPYGGGIIGSVVSCTFKNIDCPLFEPKNDTQNERSNNMSENAKWTLWEVAAITRPKPKESEEEDTEPGIVLTPITVVAKNPQDAVMRVAVKYLKDKDLTRVEVLVRPFSNH